MKTFAQLRGLLLCQTERLQPAVMILKTCCRNSILEHYSNEGALDRVLEDATSIALYSTVIEAGLVSRLGHAAYLGRELARAEHALLTRTDYVQDHAPGQIGASPTTSCNSAA